ncbi:hypothetical protein J6590_012403 [Homalodisca vitripennis]|nr:hypothetical protein J6590_012403 [Homalodisca vitripennis]
MLCCGLAARYRILKSSDSSDRAVSKLSGFHRALRIVTCCVAALLYGRVIPRLICERGVTGGSDAALLARRQLKAESATKRDNVWFPLWNYIVGSRRQESGRSPSSAWPSLHHPQYTVVALISATISD